MKTIKYVGNYPQVVAGGVAFTRGEPKEVVTSLADALTKDKATFVLVEPEASEVAEQPVSAPVSAVSEEPTKPKRR